MKIRLYNLFLASSLLIYISADCFAVVCMPTSSLIQNWSNTGPVGSDGKVHVTFDFIDSSGNFMTPDANVLASANAAIAEWNALSGTTNVQFDPLPSGQAATAADLQIELVTDGSDSGCAKYTPADSRIHYASTFIQSATGSNDTGRLILAHELGHTLGLDDMGTAPLAPTIMNNPSNPLPGACTSPNIQTTHVQQSDANQVPSCSSTARAYMKQMDQRLNMTQRIDGSNPQTFTTPPPPQTCVYTYYTVKYFVNGQYDSSQDFVESVSCY